MKTTSLLRAPRLVAILTLAFATLSASNLSAQTTVSTEPVGVTVVSITGGTIAVPSTTAFTIQLTDVPGNAGASSAAIASLPSSSSLVVTNAGWAPGGLSSASAPFNVKITSGAAIGLTFAVNTTVANTSDTLTLAAGTDLTAAGVVAGDTFKLIPVDTLDTLFPAGTFLGASSAANADVITLGTTSSTSYFYNTTAGQWRRTFGSTANQGTVKVLPNTYIQVVRKDVAMSLPIVGAVPTVVHKQSVNNSGSTFIAAGFPTDVTLGALSLQTLLPGWTSGASAAVADVITVQNGSTRTSYFFNGTNWRRTFGSTASQDTVVIPAGRPFQVNKKGSTPGTSVFSRNVPFAL